MWHVAQWVSRAPPHNSLPAFLNLNGRFLYPILFWMHRMRTDQYFWKSFVTFQTIAYQRVAIGKKGFLWSMAVRFFFFNFDSISWSISSRDHRWIPEIARNIFVNSITCIDNPCYPVNKNQRFPIFDSHNFDFVLFGCLWEVFI